MVAPSSLLLALCLLLGAASPVSAANCGDVLIVVLDEDECNGEPCPVLVAVLAENVCNGADAVNP